MPTPEKPLPALEFHPLTPDRWPDLEALFGPRGAYAGCWCMWWRLKRSEFERQQGEGNRLALQRIVEGGETPGILAYAAGQPVGWCSVAPREAFPVLDRSRVLKRVDDRPVWSIVCFYVARGFRRQGVMAALLRAAVGYAGERGARIVEGYPLEPRKASAPDPYVYTGVASVFRAAGFSEVARRSETRPIMRIETGPALIFHITSAEAWAQAGLAGRYEGDTLASEGFIHCSTAGQVARVAGRWFAGRSGLLLLCIDTAHVGVEIRYEAAPDGERFPHIYGPLEVEAVARVLDFDPGPDGRFRLPAGAADPRPGP